MASIEMTNPLPVFFLARFLLFLAQSSDLNLDVLAVILGDEGKGRRYEAEH
jgi:hypothetical protein